MSEEPNNVKSGTQPRTSKVEGWGNASRPPLFIQKLVNFSQIRDQGSKFCAGVGANFTKGPKPISFAF